ncbi:MAG: kelch repeat-containing protein, partial [Micromonosporaceae bacterium]
TAQAEILAGQTTVQDFALQPVDSVTISGTVTDGSGHGWPLYAHIQVSGAPIPDVYTDPLTGAYSLSVPEGLTVTLTVNALSPGYNPETREVTAEPGGVVEDFALTVESACTALGYDLLPVEEGVGSGAGGHTLEVRPVAATDPAPQAIGEGSLTTLFASNNGFAGNTFDIEPTVPLVIRGFDVNISPAGGQHTVTIYWKEGTADGFESDPAAWTVLGSDVVTSAGLDQPTHVDVGGLQLAPGETYGFYVDLESYPSGTLRYTDGGPATFSNAHLELTTYVGKANPAFTGSTFAFRQWNGTVHYDLEGVECGPVPGGLLVGHVTEQNEGTPLNGATVTSVGNPDDSATTVATPDDPNLDDGFYILFSSLTGSQQFTASARGYQDDTRTVDVVADAVTEANFSVGAGHLVVEPGAVQAEKRLGSGTVQRTFTITNDGTAPAEVELGERRGGFEMLGGPTAAPGEVRYVTGVFSPTANPTAGAPAAGSAASGPAAPPWTNLAPYPVNVMDNSAELVDGVLYSFGGYNGSTRLPNTYRYDPAADEWTRVADMPAERMKPETVQVDGLVYVLGGWDNAGVTHSTVFVYDPEADSWSQAADMPAGRTAPGVAVLDGQVYVVGGCLDASQCLTGNNLWRYDPASDSWTELANYPRSVAWLGCAGLADQVICTGGTDGLVAFTDTYAYDPATDSWTELADLPYDNWAMVADAANGQLVVSGGVTNGFSTVTNRSAAYDPVTDTWTEIEPSNNTVYRAGGACGFYKVGGSTGGFTPTTGVERHPEFTDCDVTTDVPWFSVDPVTSTLQPGESVTVTVTMDSAVDQPGTYTGGVAIRHNTPYRVDPVGVTMVVTPPNTWGKLSGTVTGTSCQGGTQPLAGALVQVNGKQDSVTLFTDAEGRYAWWMPVQNNPVQLIVVAGGYIPQARTTMVAPRSEQVENFTLTALC